MSDDSISPKGERQADTSAWKEIVARYQKPAVWRGVWQIVNTLVPRVLQWFSGNIGYHHIHHLSSRIPNYHLEKCHKAEALFQSVKPVTLFSSFKSFTSRLWDEQRRKLVGYGHLRNLRRQQREAVRG